jgi:hypothetical protein
MFLVAFFAPRVQPRARRTYRLVYAQRLFSETPSTQARANGRPRQIARSHTAPKVAGV